MTADISLTVSEATIFTFPVRLQVPAALIDDHDDEQPTLTAWLAERSELWMDAIDPSKHMQDTQDLDILFIDLQATAPNPSARRKTPPTGTVLPTSDDQPEEEGTTTHAPPLP